MVLNGIVAGWLKKLLSFSIHNSYLKGKIIEWKRKKKKRKVKLNKRHEKLGLKSLSEKKLWSYGLVDPKFMV